MISHRMHPRHGFKPGRAEEWGDWEVDIGSSIHGRPILSHDLEERVILMGLPKLAGWEPFGRIMLSHQTRVEKVRDWLDDNPFAREVAVLEVDTGTWQTVWSADNHDPIHGDPEVDND